MSSTLRFAADRRGHPPQPALAASSRSPRRVGLLDRAALRVGLLLITWSRRTYRSRTDLAARHRADRAAESRRLAAQRRMLLMLPPR